jgi:hypothetical protein
MEIWETEAQSGEESGRIGHTYLGCFVIYPYRVVAAAWVLGKGARFHSQWQAGA